MTTGGYGKTIENGGFTYPNPGLARSYKECKGIMGYGKTFPLTENNVFLKYRAHGVFGGDQPGGQGVGAWLDRTVGPSNDAVGASVFKSSYGSTFADPWKCEVKYSSDFVDPWAKGW